MQMVDLLESPLAAAAARGASVSVFVTAAASVEGAVKAAPSTGEADPCPNALNSAADAAVCGLEGGKDVDAAVAPTPNEAWRSGVLSNTRAPLLATSFVTLAAVAGNVAGFFAGLPIAWCAGDGGTPGLRALLAMSAFPEHAAMCACSRHSGSACAKTAAPPLRTVPTAC